MAKFKIMETESFWEDYSKLEPFYQNRIERFIFQLQENGDKVGKPLGFTFIREKKFNGNRLYFLIYEEWNIILLWGISGKKDQSIKIQTIKATLEELKEYVRKKITIDSEDDEVSKDESDLI